jgi:hypothetical protein
VGLDQESSDGGDRGRAPRPRHAPGLRRARSGVLRGRPSQGPPPHHKHPRLPDSVLDLIPVDLADGAFPDLHGDLRTEQVDPKRVAVGCCRGHDRRAQALAVAAALARPPGWWLPTGRPEPSSPPGGAAWSTRPLSTSTGGRCSAGSAAGSPKARPTWRSRAWSRTGLLDADRAAAGSVSLTRPAPYRAPCRKLPLSVLFSWSFRRM